MASSKAIKPDPDAPAGAPKPTARWEEYADGRLRRLRRGRHYRGQGEGVQNEARAAAERLGKRAVTYRDRIGKAESVWIQFVDGAIRPGEPCPRCAATTLHRTQRYFYRCPSCRAFYETASRNTPYEGAAIEGVVEFLGAGLQTLDGRETAEVGPRDEVVVEARYRFERAVAGIHPSVTFHAGSRVVLRTGCPDVIAVAGPQTVRFTLHVDGGVLGVGEYVVHPSIQLALEPHDDRILKLNAVHPVPFRVVDHATADGGSDRVERSRLHWTVVAGSDGEPEPAVVRELRALDGLGK